MTRRLVEALHRRPVDRTPVWVMRQAGRHLPEYRDLRRHHSFQEAVRTPAVAAEITLQPIRRYGMDGAVIFADIMTPLEAMGVDVEFTPGPSLRPHSLGEVADLAGFDPDRVGFVAETIRLVRAGLPADTAVIGFAGAPMTLLAYLVEGGGSKDFSNLRAAVLADPTAADAALDGLARAMNDYLGLQVAAGADAVQLFDTWSGVFDRDTWDRRCRPAATTALAGLDVPTIYFAPGAGHTLALQPRVGATAYGLDWRQPIDEAWNVLGDVAVQGNVDPAILRTDPESIAAAVADVLRRVGARPGHVMNLGHGIDRSTLPEMVTAFVDAVRS